MNSPYREAPPQRVYRWTVEIEVAAHVVAEGFDLDDSRIHAALCRAFPVYYPEEITARVLTKPDPKDIQEELGT